MKAAVCVEHGAPLRIESLTLAAPGHGEVRVAIKACAICHSDLLYASGDWGEVAPVVLGHEAAGVVEAVGPGVGAFAPGDRVVATLIRSCGSCRCCAAGKSIACEGEFPLDRRTPLSRSDGTPVAQGLRTGAFAEAIVVDQSQLAHCPPDVSMEAAALLACGVLTGLGAVVNTAQVRPGATVSVVGVGGVGINAVQGARIAGASAIIAVDLAEEKLAFAKRFGATHAVRADAPDSAEQVRAATAGRGADYVFVCVGVSAVMDSALALLAPGGAMVVVGMPPSGRMAGYEPAAFASAGQRILGSKMGDARIQFDIPYLIDLYRQGRLELDALITGRYPLEEINAAIAASQSGSALRNLIVFP